MARDISRFRIPHRNRPDYDEYVENDYLPPEVVSYLEMSRRRPYLMRGLLAGALIGLAGVWIILESRRRRSTQSSRLTTAFAPAV
ncbi:MAG TPA: hypothetical protein VMZ25_01825 [Terriglobales bacterium]|nr:hypothetical protein [Terriglobales bacterium]